MSYEILVPQLSFSMTEGTLSEWLVNDGATVSEGDLIYAIEADKSTVEVPAPKGGILKIVGLIGETYGVGTVIGYLS
jgi:pyruvate/2-oxoglutarate dehydrogenase complex dihydrolipoamide acyltransferase (E2) component